jgi:hypothetical protein
MADASRDRWAITAAKVAIALMVLLMIVVIVLNADIAAKGAQQFTNTNMAAPFSALGFLAAMAGVLLAIVVIVGAVISGHPTIARAMGLVALIGVVLYGAMLVGYSARSRDVTLIPGQEKFFCEIDCHIGYAISEVNREGDNVRVSLRTHFDERTIAPWRGDGPLTPSARVIELLDASEGVYPAHQTGGPSLTTPLRPGESYTSEFSFRLPADARDPRLLVATAGAFPERLMIGNENSFLHHKVLFRLGRS